MKEKPKALRYLMSWWCFTFSFKWMFVQKIEQTVVLFMSVFGWCCVDGCCVSLLPCSLNHEERQDAWIFFSTCFFFWQTRSGRPLIHCDSLIPHWGPLHGGFKIPAEYERSNLVCLEFLFFCTSRTNMPKKMMAPQRHRKMISSEGGQTTLIISLIDHAMINSSPALLSFPGSCQWEIHATINRAYLMGHHQLFLILLGLVYYGK